MDEYRYLYRLFSLNRTKDSVGQMVDNLSYHSSFYGSKWTYQNRTQYEGKQLIISDVIIIHTYFIPELKHGFIIKDEMENEYVVKGFKELEYNFTMEITAQYKSNK